MNWSSIGQIFGAYETVKGRNNSVQKFGGCRKMVYTFAKDGNFDGPGQRGGQCGTQKDHRRIYTCKRCFDANF